MFNKIRTGFMYLVWTYCGVQAIRGFMALGQSWVEYRHDRKMSR